MKSRYLDHALVIFRGVLRAFVLRSKLLMSALSLPLAGWGAQHV